MRRVLTGLFFMAAAAATGFVQTPAAGRRIGPLAVAVDAQDGASLTTVRLMPPWRARTGIATTGPQSTVRLSGRVAYTASRGDGTVRVIDLGSRRTLRIFQLGASSAPQDVAVVSERRAYVTLADSATLLRIDPVSGETARVVDLSPFADADGDPDPSMMAVHEGRLFIQLQRLNADAPFGQERPALLAVVDLATETLVDTDPDSEGVQAIALEGTFPKFKMQIVEESRRLFVSATGAFFDDGGIEMIDLDALRSLGLVIRERDGLTGADLGAFVMVTPETGYLIFSTDLLLSSHLQRFSLRGGVESGPELHVSLDYFVPALAHDAATRQIFLPDGGIRPGGVFVFDAETGERLSSGAIPVGGMPSDAALAP